MKELSIKEKANAYDNVRNKIATRFGSNMAEEIFSEFEMSEDERIRRELIKVFSNREKYLIDQSLGDITVSEALAWLEKQKSVTFDSTEDERIRKTLFTCIDIGFNNGQAIVAGLNTTKEEALAWLEKQQKPTDVEEPNFFDDFRKSDVEVDSNEDGLIADTIRYKKEQKPADKPETAFHEGDWIVQENIGVYKVIEVCESWYEVIDIEDNHYSIGFDKEYMCHLWSIQDAKPGDVLTYNDSKNNVSVCIFKKYANERVYDYCTLDKESFWEHGNWNYLASFSYIPATKKQRDLLFQKMREAGYTFDFEKKKLKKIEDKPLVIDEGKAEMDYCFTKMINDEKVTPAWGEEEFQLKEGNFYKCIKSYHHLCGNEYWFNEGKVYFCEKDGYLRSDHNNLINVYDCKNWQRYFRLYTGKPEQPKFNIGAWIVSDLEDMNEDFRLCKIIDIKDGCYTIQNTNGGEGYNFFEIWESDYHLWSIKDAKPGDVLVTDFEEDNMIVMYHSMCTIDTINVCCCLDNKFACGNLIVFDAEDVKPATKEQRELLFQKMKESGYEWDSNQKELKKINWNDHIKYNPNAPSIIKESDWSYEDEANLNNIIWLCNNCINGSETTWIPSQAMEIKHLIETIKERGLPQHKPIEWNEEDEAKLKSTCAFIRNTSLNGNEGVVDSTIDWIKSLKGRVQPVQEWSEEDESIVENILYWLKSILNKSCYPRYEHWINFLKDRVQSKQEWSEEDERTYKSILYAFKYNYPLTIEQQKFIKSLRPQLKQEWSEEDENKISSILYLLHELNNYNFDDWLKSLKPQNRWISIDKEVYIKEPVLAQKKDKSDPFKGYVVCCDHTLVPNIYERYIRLDHNCSQNMWKLSDEQMQQLNIVSTGKGWFNKKPLREMYEQLKKLKGE